MSLFKKACLSIMRNKGKTALLLTIIIGLGTLMSGTIAISHSINRTRDNLWRQLPPVAVIDVDHDAIMSNFQETGEFADFNMPTFDVYQQISDLSSVKSFDIFREAGQVRQLYSFELEEYWPFAIDYTHQNLFNIFRSSLEGVSNPNIFNIESGILELVAGRTFTEEEMEPVDTINSVVMISRNFAELNNLDVGSVITLEQRMHEHHFGFKEPFRNGMFFAQDPDYSEDTLVVNRLYTFEVVGIFEIIASTNWGQADMDDWYVMDNVFYIPLPAALEIEKFADVKWIEVLNDFYEEQLQLGADESVIEMLEDEIWRHNYFNRIENLTFNNIFLLHDSADLTVFHEAALELLPDFMRIATLSDSMRSVLLFEEALAPIQEISFFMVLGSGLFTTFALGLVVLLVLRDRKKEIGIYLALGEEKKNIFLQMILEIVIPSVLGLTIALFVGNIIASQISQEMLVNDIAASQNFDWGDYGVSQAEVQLIWHLDDHLVMAIENYDVSLDGTTIGLFFAIGMVTVFVSTTLPLIHIMRLEPKEILTAD